MTPGQLAAVAAAAATEGGTAKAALVLKELAKLTLQLSHEELQATAAGAALEGLQVLERTARDCITLLIEALCKPDQGHERAADAAWTLYKLTQRCDVARQWMLDAQGLAAVRHALLAHSAHHDLVQCLFGIVHSLDGLRGLASLLTGCAGGDAARLPDSVIATIVWCVHDLLKQDQRGSEAEVATLLALFLQLLAQRSQSLEVQHACCSTLGIIVSEDARMGALLAERGGIQLLLRALLWARALDSAGADLSLACVDAIASLAKGSSQQAELLRRYGAVDVLTQCCSDGRGGRYEESAAWALGHLAGIVAVTQTMVRTSSLGVLHGGLEAISALAGQVSTLDELRQLPEVLELLLGILPRTLGPQPEVRCFKKCTAAICSLLLGLAPHAEPGQSPTLDKAVRGLLEVQSKELEKDIDVEIAESTVESIGRLALLKPSWRHFLRSHGAVEVCSRRIRSGQDCRSLAVRSIQQPVRRLLKYAFWAAAALSGLPFVCSELRQNLRSAETIDAAFCTIIDILDDDLEGDWVLKEAERCTEDAVPGVLRLIAEAMAGYPADCTLQGRGCHCVGLLVGLAPAGPEHAKAIEAVFTASRRHPWQAHVVRDACYAFLRLLEGGAGEAGAAEVLRRGGADRIAEQALANHAHAHNAELLEEAVVVTCYLSGIPAALRVLTDAGPGPVRTNGIKAIAEFGRQRQGLLLQSAQDVVPAVTAMAGENPGDELLQQNVQLLVGFCNVATDR
uniref:Uncharacterized protein n=1 Tax=Alexandrium monilatum TaxID=311494 RepID=A0A7S4VPU4_9DINO